MQMQLYFFDSFVVLNLEVNITIGNICHVYHFKITRLLKVKQLNEQIDDLIR